MGSRRRILSKAAAADGAQPPSPPSSPPPAQPADSSALHKAPPFAPKRWREAPAQRIAPRIAQSQSARPRWHRGAVSLRR